MSNPMPYNHEGSEQTLMATNQTITNTESES
ncbi:hypothetical protein WP8S18E11_10050 [Aeromonas veronii]|nr:hypothetical protein WP8S18E11_10050 [Aeromonas veronii]